MVVVCLVLCLFSVSAWAQSENLAFSISPTTLNLNDVENFIALHNFSAGTDSTVIRYTLGQTSVDIAATEVGDPQLGAVSYQAWVPVVVAINAGSWSVSIIATDTDQSVRTYGPVSFVVSAGPAGTQGVTLPEVVVGEAETSAGGHVNFDVGGASCDHASGDLFAMGFTTVHCGSDSFGVVVTDTVAPVITVPANFASASHTPTFTVTATDLIDGAEPSIRINCEPESGATFPDGTTTVQCGAQDAHANYSFAHFDIFVGVPVLHLPNNVTAEATSAAGAVVNYTATADAADAPLQCSPASGSNFAIATTTVNCSASNVAGTATGSFTVTVQDTTPPALNLTSVTAEATSAAGAVVNYAATAMDLVDGAVTPVCSPASGTTFAIATTTVNCTATDAHGNTASGSFTVRVQDTTPPALNLTNLTVEATSASGATVNYTASETATDIVDGAVTPVCSPASGTVFALGTTTVNCTATDAHGNSASGSFTVRVRDTTPPVIDSIDASPHDILWPPNHKLIPITMTVTAHDTVDPHPHAVITGVTSDQPDNCFCGDGDTSGDIVITGDLTLQVRAERTGGINRNYTVTITVTDASGNATTGTFVISVHV